MRPIVEPPQQERSLRSYNRMVAAGRKLISRGAFDEATVADIVEEAGLSVGAFYVRFKDKNTLFLVIQDALLLELMTLVKTRVSAFVEKTRRKKKRPDARSVAKFMVSFFLELYTHAPGLMRAIFIHTRIKKDKAMYNRIRAFNSDGVDVTFDILNLFLDAPATKAQKQKWTGAVGVIGVYLRETLLLGPPMPLRNVSLQPNEQDIVTRMFETYLEDIKSR